MNVKKELRLLIRAYFIRGEIKETSIRWITKETHEPFMKGYGIKDGNPITIGLIEDDLNSNSIIYSLFSQNWKDAENKIPQVTFHE